MYKMLFRFKKHAGFTLIELMVVIGIIGVLATIILIAVDEARANARDKQRKVDLKQLELALELYREANGRYPSPGCGYDQTYWITPGPANGAYRACDEYISGLAPTFIPELPMDPNNAEENYNEGFMYRVLDDGSEYKVMTRNSVESSVLTSVNDDFSRCDSSCTGVWGTRCSDDAFFQTYAVYRDTNPGSNGGSECF